MAKARNLSNLVSQGGILADGAIQYTEITGTPPIPAVLKCTSIQYPGDDLAANPAGGQTITLIGTGFEATPTVYVGGVVASSVSFISSTQITFTSPARTAGTYDVYVVNPGGATAIFVMGISYSGVPNWTTAAGSLGTVDANFSIQLQATSNSTVTYALANGSTLPSGVALSSSGLLTGTALSVEQTFTFSVVATDLENQDTARSFQVTVSLADPFFRNVTLLLAGDTPVAPFNSDLSTNNFNVSINGDTKPNSFNPHTPGYYSNFFNGSSYLQIASNSALNMNTHCCLEGWVNITTLGSNTLIFGRDSSYWLGYDFLGIGGSAGKFVFAIYNGSTWQAVSSTTSPVAGQWYHIVGIRDNNTLRIYINGTQENTGTFSGTANISATPFGIASNQNTQNITAFISNVRLIIGSSAAVLPYTANFTPSTTPLTTTANTVLLTCQANRFIDNSAAPLTITTAGSPQVVAYDPFVLPSNLQTLGSTFFDGNGDSFNVVANTNIAFGTGDFTVEAWVYPRSFPLNTYVVDTRPNASWSLSFNYQGTNGTNSQLAWSDSNNIYQTTTATPLNQWNHVAYTRSGTTGSLYLNGVRVLTFTDTFNYTTSGTMWIGARHSNTMHWDGYMSNLRIVQGTAVYTGASYTVPTAPLTAVTNTRLLTLQTNQGASNSGFLDSSLNSFPIQRFGNTTQGTFTPYGSNWSNYFDGSSHLSIPTNAAFSLGTGAFTVEAWAYIPTGNGSGANRIVGLGVGASGGAPHYTAWGLQATTISSLYSTANVAWYRFDGTETVYTTNTSPFIVGQWNHLVVTRNSSNNLAIFVNGTRALSTTSSVNYNAVNSDDLFIGRTTSGGGTPNLTTGYISDVRVVKGTAVYDPTQTTITIPTAPLTAITNTSLLTCQSNRFRDNSTNNFTVTPTGSPTVQRFSPVNPTAAHSPATIGGSAYFDGSGDYLTIPASPALSFGTRDFTISTWIYTGVDSLTPGGYSRSPFTLGNIIGYLRISQYHGGTTGAFRGFLAGTIICDGSTVKLSDNAWHNITIVRESGIIRHWIDGVYVGAVSYSSSITNTITNGIGADMNGPDASWNGYIAGTYVNNGTALFTGTSNITVPSTPPTISNGNSLLLNYTNAGIIDNAMMNNLETVGNAQISTARSKFGGASMLFNGSTDALAGPSSQNLAFGTGDFTVEGWFYQTADNSYPTAFEVGNHISSTGIVFITKYAGNACIYSGAFYGAAATTLNTWNHIAWVRSSGVLRIFVNGIVGSTTAFTNNLTDASFVRVGTTGSLSPAAYYFAGYIDDLRITKGYARYTANFTPPTLAFKLR